MLEKQGHKVLKFNRKLTVLELAFCSYRDISCLWTTGMNFKLRKSQQKRQQLWYLQLSRCSQFQRWKYCWKLIMRVQEKWQQTLKEAEQVNQVEWITIIVVWQIYTEVVHNYHCRYTRQWLWLQLGWFQEYCKLLENATTFTAGLRPMTMLKSSV